MAETSNGPSSSGNAILTNEGNDAEDMSIYIDEAIGQLFGMGFENLEEIQKVVLKTLEKHTLEEIKKDNFSLIVSNLIPEEEEPADNNKARKTEKMRRRVTRSAGKTAPARKEPKPTETKRKRAHPAKRKKGKYLLDSSSSDESEEPKQKQIMVKPEPETDPLPEIEPLPETGNLPETGRLPRNNPLPETGHLPETGPLPENPPGISWKDLDEGTSHLQSITDNIRPKGGEGSGKNWAAARERPEIYYLSGCCSRTEGNFDSRSRFLPAKFSFGSFWRDGKVEVPKFKKAGDSGLVRSKISRNSSEFFVVCDKTDAVGDVDVVAMDESFRLPVPQALSQMPRSSFKSSHGSAAECSKSVKSSNHILKAVKSGKIIDHTAKISAVLDQTAEIRDSDECWQDYSHILTKKSPPRGSRFNESPHHESPAHDPAPLDPPVPQSPVVVEIQRGFKIKPEPEEQAMPPRSPHGPGNIPSEREEFAAGEGSSAAVNVHDPSDISNGREDIPIPWINDYSSETPPGSFHYMTGKWQQENAFIVRSDLRNQSGLNFLSQIRCISRNSEEEKCQCIGDCQKSEIGCYCTNSTRGVFPYDSDGRLKDTVLEKVQNHWGAPLRFCSTICPLVRSQGYTKCPGHIIHVFLKECSQFCLCNKKLCGNRVVQNGIKLPVEVFFTPTGKGWGVRCRTAIRKGTFVFEYIGEILTCTESFDQNAKMQSASDNHLTYAMTLDADWGTEQFVNDDQALCLDATYYGNVSRFVNHRCEDANLVVIPVLIESPSVKLLYHVAFFASVDIEAKEELTWDYGLNFEDENHPVKAFSCLCGSSFCRGNNTTPKMKIIRESKTRNMSELR